MGVSVYQDGTILGYPIVIYSQSLQNVTQRDNGPAPPKIRHLAVVHVGFVILHPADP